MPRAKIIPQTAALTPILLAELAEDWLLDGEYRNHSPRTLAERRRLLECFFWFLEQRRACEVTERELKAFFIYAQNAHESPTGRWDNAGQVHHATKPLRPVTLRTYHDHLQTLFRYLLEKRLIEENPMAGMAPPVVRADQIQPFTDEQVRGILAEAGKSRYPRRDRAIVLMLADTGLRASELCGLRWRDVESDLTGSRLVVLGKGNKRRVVPFSRDTRMALAHYARQTGQTPELPVFRSETDDEGPLTRNGLLQLIERLGRRAGITRERCSPHTFRHYFAVSFLRAGANVYELQAILGHRSLAICRRYVELAEADVTASHRKASPVQRLLRGGNP